MIGLGLIGLLSALARSPIPAEIRPGTIPVAVLAPADVSDGLITRMCAETTAIWRTAGVTVECRRIFADAPAEADGLDVTIEERPAATRSNRSAMGWITFTADVPGRSIHLSRSAVDALLLQTPGLGEGSVFTHDALLGRALGRALSHEIGHYLLKSRTHTAHGLMRAVWPSEEFFGVSRDGFELSSTERAVAARQICGERLPTGGP